MTATRRLTGGLLLMLATLLGVATSAWAHWTASGTGGGSATTATLNPPTAVTASSAPGTSAVNLTWNVPTGGIAPQGYSVTRKAQPGSTPEPACGGATISIRACTDSSVSDGTYSYIVTAVYASWSTASEPSNTVTVTSAPVDTTNPTVIGVSSTAANGSYRAGTSIPITVTFSEPVTVTGTPRLSLATGAGTTSVNYTSGSGGTTLTFTYAVATGDTSADLDYESATSLTLNGGTIRDAASNDAALTLPAPGATGSLGANKALVIDTAAPAVHSISRVGPSPARTGPLLWTITFSEPVTGVQAANFTLTTTGIAGTTPSVSSVTAVNSSAGGASDAWTVAVGTSGTTGTNTGSIRLDLTNTAAMPVIIDTAANPMTSPFTSGQDYSYDTTAPTVLSITRVGASPTNATTLAWTVTFSEPVTGVTAASFSLPTTGTITGTPSITDVTPSATASVWTVIASTSGTTGTGTGSIQLNLDRNLAAIADAPTNPLAAPFTVGQAYTFDNTVPLVALTDLSKVGGSGKVRVSGSGEVGIPVTVTLCFSPTADPLACTANEIITVPALTGTTWQVTSTIRAQGVGGTWYATASQTDLAGNTSTVTGPPLPN